MGISLLGLVGAITISGIQSTSVPSAATQVIDFLHLENLSFQVQVALIATLASLILVSRSAISLYLSKRILYFFAKKSSELSAKIIRKIFQEGLEEVRKSSRQQILYTTTTGCDLLMIGVIAQGINLIADIALLILITFGILWIQPATAITAVLVFGIASLIMHKRFNKRARGLGSLGANQNVSANNLIEELFSTYRETFVRNSQHLLIGRIQYRRLLSSNTQAGMTYLPLLNKYFLEFTLIFGALAVAAVQFLLQDARSAIVGLALFLAAGSRLIPSLLRVQQSFLNIRNSLGGAEKTISLVKSMPNQHQYEDLKLDKANSEFKGIVDVQDLSFDYEGSDRMILDGISLKMLENSIFAITGPSGSGKTTLVDLILGILAPKSGKVTISGYSPEQAIQTCPTLISYVPQEVPLVSGSFAANVALGVNIEDIDLSRVSRVCGVSRLGGLIENLPDGLDTILGTPGITLSGGERQRLGLARALYTDPKLLVLDEPTSALDLDSESQIAEALSEIKQNTTIIIIAHRASILRYADYIYYLERGRLKAEGSLADLKKKLPNFEQSLKELN